MAKKRVPISLRKPSRDAAAGRPSGEGTPEAEPPAAPPVEAAARIAEPEVAAAAAQPEVVACAAAPEVTAPVMEPVVVARVAEVEVAAPVAEPSDALRHVAPEVPAAIVVGADGRAMRAVTIYLPAELVDRLMLYCMEQGRDVLREAIEASLGKRLGEGVAAASAEAARAVPLGSAGAAQRGAARRLAARVERWLDLGRTFVQTLRVHVRSAGAEVGAG